MKNSIDIPIFILAGGRGTRLASVVSDVPKPMAPVSGVPFLRYLLENYIEQGFKKFYFLLHFKADIVINYVEDLKKTILEDCDIRYSLEPGLLGTGGAVAFALDAFKYQGRFLIVNADTWVSSESMIQIATSIAPAVGVIEVSDVSRYGKVTIDGDFILEFEEKKENGGKGLINAGIYHLDSSNFKGKTGEFSLEKDIFPDLVNQKKLRSIQLMTEFIDIGIPEDYQKFQNWIINGRKKEL